MMSDLKWARKLVYWGNKRLSKRISKRDEVEITRRLKIVSIYRFHTAEESEKKKKLEKREAKFFFIQ